MTRLEILSGYSNKEIYDTWTALGSNRIRETTHVYTEGMLYRLSIPNIPEVIIYCKKEFIGPIRWDKMKLEDYNRGEISFENGIISSCFLQMLTAPELADLDKNPTPIPGFVPFRDNISEIGSLHISDSDYQLCTRCLGAPFITDEELEYSKGEIIDLAIRPALERYFKYFPKTEIICEPITGSSQEVEFPENAYDVIHFSVQQRGASGAGMITNPLLRYWDEGMYSGGFGATINGHYHGTFSPKTQTNTMETFALGRAAQQAVVNYRTRYHLDKIQKIVLPDGVEDTELNRNRFGIKKRFLRFYSNKGGTAEIHFAVRSLDFDDVEFARRPELLELCNAEIKKLFGNLRRQVKSDIPGVVDYGSWITEANETIKSVEENWKSIVKYSSIIRGSL